MSHSRTRLWARIITVICCLAIVILDDCLPNRIFWAIIGLGALFAR